MTLTDTVPVTVHVNRPLVQCMYIVQRDKKYPSTATQTQKFSVNITNGTLITSVKAPLHWECEIDGGWGRRLKATSTTGKRILEQNTMSDCVPVCTWR